MSELEKWNEHLSELEYLVGTLEKIADLELPSTDGITDFGISQDRWRKFCEAQEIAASAIAQYRKKSTRPLTIEELLEGGWWCADVSKDCANALESKGFRVLNSVEWGAECTWISCAMGNTGDIERSCFVSVGNKQIHRIGNEFYWS